MDDNELEGLIAKWQKRYISACPVIEALNLSDSFNDACREGKPVPGWALAIRSLSARLRLLAEAKKD